VENKPKTYWQEFWPLWQEDIKSWLGFGGWKVILTDLVVLFGIIYTFLALGQTEEALNDIQRFFITVKILAAWLVYVGAASYITANIKLYNNQVEKRKELGGFTENPFRVEVYPPDSKLRRGERRRWSLELNNKMPHKKIENCYMSLDKVFNTKNNKPPERVQLNLMWNVREQNQLQPLTISGGGRAVCDVVIEAGDTSVYYLTWISEKSKKFVDTGEYILVFTIFGDWDKNSKGFQYHCKMKVDERFEVSLSDIAEGEYTPQEITKK
jgi:hypothetical protein